MGDLGRGVYGVIRGGGVFLDVLDNVGVLWYYQGS